MNYKNVSSRQIILKVYRDFGISYSSWESDAIEWMGEALDFIGHCSGFLKKSTDLTVANYRVALPADFYQIRGVEYNDMPLKYGGSIVSLAAESGYFEEAMYTSPMNSFIELTNSGMTRYGSGLVSYGSESTDYYLINPGYIQTSFEAGDITLLYNAYPVDGSGYPMVPDNIYYKQALAWYIMSRLILRGYAHPSINFEYANRMWGKYCVSAQNDAKYPDIPMMDRFREMWVRLIPENTRLDEFDTVDYNRPT